MCELPANVKADEFLRVFDGYSIGSNDLTQLTLGVDRDSALVAPVFDERDGAVENGWLHSQLRQDTRGQENWDLRTGAFGLS